MRCRTRVRLVCGAACLWLMTTGCTGGDAPGPAPGDKGVSSPTGGPVVERSAPTSCPRAGRPLVTDPVEPPIVPVLGQGTDRPPPIAAASVFDFVSSIGVNIHATYDDTPYIDHDHVIAALQDLGIRHVRDGLVPGREADQHPFLRRLARAGICSSLIIGDKAADTTQIAQVLDNLSRVTQTVELVESSNEPDVALGDTWTTRLATYQRRLAERLREAPGVSDVPLVGPTFARLDALGVAAELTLPFDIGALHPYPGGGPPSSHLADNLAVAGFDDELPVIASEHGYHTALASRTGQPGVPEDVAAVYVPRLFLESFAAGVDRTYLYELVDQFSDPEDDDAESQFGLLRTDFSDKPSARALRNLLHVLDSRAEVQFDAAPLGIRIETDAPDVHGVLLQAHTGTWWLAVWQQTSIFELSSAEPIVVDAVDATVVVERAVDVVIYRPVADDGVHDRASSVTHVDVDVPADPLLISLHADER